MFMMRARVGAGGGSCIGDFHGRRVDYNAEYAVAKLSDEEQVGRR